MFRSRYKANSRYVSIEARNESLQFSSSFIARGAGASAFQSCPSDPMIRSRYKANSRYVSIEAYPFVLPCGERIEGERIDACSGAARACCYSSNFRLEKIDFCLVSCAATGGPPQALVPVSALPDHGLGLLHFSL